MKGLLLFILLAALTFTASCIRQPLLADAGDVIPRLTATDAEPAAPITLIEMPPLYVDSSEIYRKRIITASAEATELSSQQLNCPAVRVRRADSYIRADGAMWTVVRLNVCGEERVYEKTDLGWNEATARLR